MAVVLQIILDNGQKSDWFGASWVRWSATVVAITFVAFIIRELVVKEPIVDLKVFKDKNFSIGTVLHFVIGLFCILRLQFCHCFCSS